jgi:hypothetical protein
MTFFHILVEGDADVPIVREIMTRRFRLREDEDFQIHPHQGIGRLPSNPMKMPENHLRGLLDLLPAKLIGMGKYCGEQECVLVLVDSDKTPCRELLSQLNAMLASLPHKPPRVLFRLAIEETESWFIADIEAIRKVFPEANLQVLRGKKPDAVIGAWEKLAEAIGDPIPKKHGPLKYAWAEKIAPHINLENPLSPSLGKFISGVERELQNR